MSTSLRIVLDTNVLLRAMANHVSRSGEIVKACEDRRAIALFSKPLLDEYQRVLIHLRERDQTISLSHIETLLRRLRYVGEYAREVRASFPYARDPTDSKLLELAIEANATHIITYDADLLSLPTSHREAGNRFRQQLRGVRIVRADEMIKLYPGLTGQM